MACTKLILLIFSLVCFVQIINADYIAAVVQYQPLTATTPNETVEANLAQYIYQIEQAKGSNVQIIVFPEYGLAGLVTDPNGYAIEIPNPGDNTTFTNYWLQKLSNAAVAHQMYIVVNLFELEKDANNNTIYYNTNIVFDKIGKLVAKYRKINLFQEPAITPGNPAQNQNTFVTDFGVTFGVITCYDITFYTPAVSLLSNTSVTDIVYPTAWTSNLPFYHSLSTQSGYAAANKVNLLAANLDAIQYGTGGSGIYGADGTIYSYYISGVPGTKLLIANVQNAPDRRNVSRGLGGTLGSGMFDETVPTLDDFKAQRYFLSEKYEFRRLNLSKLTLKEEVCHRTFCCLFSVNVSASSINSTEIYQIMAYKGPIAIQETIRGVKQCAMVACSSEDLNTCGERNIKTTTKFDSILVETNMPDDSEQYYQPFSLTSDLLPVFNTTFNSTVTDGARISQYLASNIIQQNIIAFGIVGNGSSTLGFGYALFFAVLFIKYILY